MAIPENFIDKFTDVDSGERRDICPAADKVRVDNDNFEGSDLDEVLDEIAEAFDDAGSGGYTPPQGGIPATDLAPAVQTSLGKADTAYQKPASGIPATDLADGVIPDASNLATKTELQQGLADKVDKVTGYGLSKNNYSDADQALVATIPNKANDNVVVKSISVNGGQAQTPTNGNVNISVQSGSQIDPATAAPSMDGTAAVGTSTKYAREDHVHPHDASKQDTLTFDDIPTAGSNKPVKSGGVKQAIDEKANIDDVYSKSDADAEFATKTELNNASIATVPSNQVAVITNLNGVDEETYPNAVLHADEGRKLKDVLLYYLVPILRKAAYSVTGANNDIDNFISSLNSQPVETGNIIQVVNIILSSGYIDSSGVVQQAADNYFYDEAKEAIAFALLDSSANAATVTSSRIAEYGANDAFLGSSYINKAQIAASRNPAKIKAGFVASTMPAYIAYFISAAPILTIADTTLDNNGDAQPWSDSTTRYATDYIDILNNKGFLLWTLKSWSDSSVCCFYDLNHTFISRHVNVASNASIGIDNYKKLDIPSNAAYARFAANPDASKTFLYAV